MSIFEICQRALSSYFGEEWFGTLDELREAADRCREQQQAEYRNPNGRPRYNDFLNKYAYLRSNLTLHVNLVAALIGDNSSLYQLFMEQPQVSIVSIGSGPATDFLGILKYLYKSSIKTPVPAPLAPYLRYLAIDAEDWGSVWVDHILPVISRNFCKTSGFIGFKLQDICSTQPDLSPSPPTLGLEEEFYEQAHLFTFIFLISELVKRPAPQLEEGEAFLQSLVLHARVGAIFLFVDRAELRARNWFDRITAAEASLQIVTKINHAKYQLETDEQMESLAGHLSRKILPRLSADYCVRILKKIPTSLLA